MALERVLVLGAGSWGTALSFVLAHNGHPTTLWARDPAHVERMRQDARNERYLGQLSFPPGLEVTHDWCQALTQARLVVVAVPSQAFQALWLELSTHLRQDHQLVWACKGLSRELKAPFFHQMVSSHFQGQYGLLAGPTFAKEVAASRPTALVMASPDLSTAKALALWFHNVNFRVYLSNDLIGVQLGGVLKNIYAVGAGLSDGLSLGANARAALLTRGLNETIRLGQALGAKPDTLMGLTGCGDLFLSCTDDQSRNRRFGLYLGQGQSQSQALESVGQVVEAKVNIAQIVHLSSEYSVEMPIVEQLHRILQDQISPLDAVKTLFARPLQEE